MVQLLFSIYRGLGSNPDLWIFNLIVLIKLWNFYLQYFLQNNNRRPFLNHSKSTLLKNPSVWTGMMLAGASSLDQTEESHFGSFSCPLSPFNPSICFFFSPKQCVSDTCNIPVADVSARDLLLDLSLLTLSATCPLFLWGFYYKTAIAPLINTRHKFNPRIPDHCTCAVSWAFRHLSRLNVIWELYYETNVCLPNVAWRPCASRRGSPVSC